MTKPLQPPPHRTRRLAAWQAALIPRLAGTGPAPLRLLVIEDSLHYQSLICMLAQQHRPDLEVHVASNDVIGMALYGATNPDVLLIDMVLPGGDVATLIRHLRAHPAFRETPLIVLSGEGSGGQKGRSDLPQDLCVIHKASLLQALPAALDATLADPAR